MSDETPTATSSKLLTTAEQLFASNGYHGVSLRQLTTEAGVNLAAVNYHYSDKESLYRQILGRRLRQVSTARLERLAAAELQAAGGIIAPEEVIDSLAQPLLLPTAAMKDFTPASRRLIGRSLVEPLPFLGPTLANDFHPAVARLGQALRRHFPSLAPADFLWRYSFVLGALHHTAATLHDMKALTRGICADEEAGAALRNFRAFTAYALGENGFR